MPKLHKDRAADVDVMQRDISVCPVLQVSLVVPVFNEIDVVGLFVERVRRVFDDNSSLGIEIVFINDGSTDGTLEKLISLQSEDSRLRIVDLSRNFGKEAALTAGLQMAMGRVIVPIDVDLQDPPELICDMVALWREGYDVVLARRISRSNDTFAKRTTAKWFYWIHNRVSDLVLPENVGDFRLMDRAVADVLNQLPETQRFMKGLLAWVGFRTATVNYDRPERSAGSSKFSGWRLWNFALEGLTSFSTSPLRIWTYIGGAVSLFSFAYGLFILLHVLIGGVDVPGYASILVTVTFLGGLQLLGIGVIGEYLGRTYFESKRRPVFVVRRIYELDR